MKQDALAAFRLRAVASSRRNSAHPARRDSRSAAPGARAGRVAQCVFLKLLSPLRILRVDTGTNVGGFPGLFIYSGMKLYLSGR